MTKCELCEDANTGLYDVQAERKGPIVSTARQAIGQAKQAHKRLDMAAKRGLGAVEPGFFDRTAWVQDLDEEEQKLVKTEGLAGGGRAQKRTEHDRKLYNRPSLDGAMEQQAAPVGGSRFGGDSFGGSIKYPASCFPIDAPGSRLLRKAQRGRPACHDSGRQTPAARGGPAAQ
jgi:hypothetical protein